MYSKFFTNQDENTLFNKLIAIFEHNKNISNFDVLVGYFRSSGYFKLRPFLENVKKIRILVGIDIDKLTKEANTLGLVYKEDEKKIQEDWQESFINDIKNANYDKETEQGIKQFVTDMLSGKVELKAHPSQKIHAKIYIFRPDNFNNHSASSVITGSSNLTDAGLGTNHNSNYDNYEFNVLLNDYYDVKFATDEFENLWKESTEILPKVAENSLKKTHLSDDITSYKLYLKMLIEYFDDEINSIDITDLPNSFKKLSYQADAVHQGSLLLKKHNGFFLADVVGLGKTVIATLIARKFWLDSQKDCTILIITPPAIKPNWDGTIKKFNFNANIDIITNGSLDKVQDKYYDLVIVDESHKFRNADSNGYNQLQKICKKTSLNEDKKLVVNYAKVILISATPLNNKPNDIFNQILLFQDRNQSTLGLPLGDFFAECNTQYNKIKGKKDNQKEVQELYETIRDKVITPLMVRRTRTDLTKNKRYEKDLEEQGIVFPKIKEPQPIYYELEAKLNTLFDNTLKQIAPTEEDEKSGKGLLYTRYRALHFLKKALKQNYKNADAMAIGLKGIMKTLLIKRMDSSFYAFNKTLNRFLASSNKMLKMIENDEIIISADKKILEYIADDNVKGILDLTEKQEGIDFIRCKKKDFEEGFVEAIEHDHKILEELVKDWGKNEQDPKINEFIKQLPTLLKKENNPEQKIVIFTESSDTMSYVSKKLNKKEPTYKILSVSGENRDKLKTTIAENFDANLAEKNKKDDYQIIITTDVLAEGINLHRANTILNYDTPWNTTKLMQRIGRVNRIGSVAKNIYIHNFYPAEQLDNAIALKQNAQTKMQGFHSALGEDSQIYSTNEIVDTYTIFDENINDDSDERLRFLEVIKKYKNEHPIDYRKLVKKPSKMRNAIKHQEHKDGTLSFIRTKDKESVKFYFVQNEIMDNWSFIKTAKLLESNCDKKNTKIPEKHYQQVSDSCKKFDEQQKQMITKIEQDFEINKKNTNLIKSFFEPLQKLPTINDEQKEALDFAIKLIKQGVYHNVSKRLKAIQEKNKKNKITLQEALIDSVKIIKSYQSQIEEKPLSKKPIDNQSMIVISQSYV